MRKASLAVGICVLTLSTPAWADRDPTPRERQAIERVLRANGFVRWDDIELDIERGQPARWEVDDARMRSGRIFDLKLEPGSYRITSRKRD